MIMAATLIDYAIAIGLLLTAFAVTISAVTGVASAAQADVRVATLQLDAMSLLGLADRDYAFNTSISGLGLSASVVDGAAPHSEVRFISSAALQRLASEPYAQIVEDVGFRIRIIDSAGAVAFAYGSTPPLANVVALSKPVLYESGIERKPGTFIIEVWR